MKRVLKLGKGLSVRTKRREGPLGNQSRRVALAMSTRPWPPIWSTHTITRAVSDKYEVKPFERVGSFPCFVRLSKHHTDGEDLGLHADRAFSCCREPVFPITFETFTASAPADVSPGRRSTVDLDAAFLGIPDCWRQQSSHSTDTEVSGLVHQLVTWAPWTGCASWRIFFCQLIFLVFDQLKTTNVASSAA